MLSAFYETGKKHRKRKDYYTGNIHITLTGLMGYMYIYKNILQELVPYCMSQCRVQYGPSTDGVE